MSAIGFAGAPVSKALGIAILTSTLVVLSNRSQDAVSVVGHRVFGEEAQWWRLLFSLFPVASVWELVLSLHAVRVFRVLERHMGSGKFGSFLCLSALLCKSIELALCVQFPFLRPPPGPLSVLSSLATTYYGYVPFTAPAYFTIGDTRVTEKFFAYSSVLVLAAHNSWSSAMCAGCGVLVALLYWANLSPLQRFRVPGQRLFAMCSATVLGEDQIATRRAQMTRLQQRDRRLGGGTQGQADQMLNGVPGAGGGSAMGLRQRLELPPPSEEDIALLMGLGFDRDTVLRVLASSGNNTEAAANRLLGQ